MDMRGVNNVVEKLSEVLKGMHKCLECAICYDTLSAPVRTQCGHLFCRGCIAILLNQKNAPCPLCKVNLTRRSFSDDNHTERCIEKTHHLALAISKDTGFNEFEQIIKPKCTKQDQPTLNSYITRSSQSNVPGTSMNNKMQNKTKSVKPSRRKRGRLPSNKLKKSALSTNTSSRLSSMSKNIDVVICGKEGTDIEDKTSRVEAWLDDLNYSRNLNDESKPTLDKKESTEINTSSDSQIMLNSSDAESDRQLNVPQIFRSGSHQDKSIPNTSQGGKVVSSHKESNFKRTEYRVDHEKVDTTNTSRINQVINATNNQQKKTKQQTCSESSENLLDSTSMKSLNMTKDTWSCVKTFGIDMRSKNKKLKSLNVSIENTGYLKSSGSIKHQKVLNTIQGKEIDNTGLSESEYSMLKRRSTDRNVNEDFTSIQSRETVIQTDHQPNIQLNQATRNVQMKSCKSNTVDENKINTSNITDASSEPDKIKDTSFIMVGEGNLIHIQNLDDCQMKDIIGVTNESTKNDNLITKEGDSDKDDKTENLEFTSQNSVQSKDNEGSRVGRAVLSLKRRSNSFNSASSNSLISSPIAPIAPIRPEKIREVLAENVLDPQKITQAPQISPTRDPPILMNTPLNTSGKLSLKKNSDTSHKKPVSPISRSLLLSSTARRNLTTEISNTSPTVTESQRKIQYNKIGAQNKANKNSTDDENDKGEETVKETSLKKNIYSENKCPNIINKYNKKSDESHITKCLNHRSFVTFKKLGRIMKVRHVTTRFFYANCLSRERAQRALSKLEQIQVYYQNVPSSNDNDIIWIPETSVTPDRKPVTVFTSTTELGKNVFSSRNTSTESGIYDETTFLRKVEQENPKSVEKKKDVVRTEYKTQESVDVVFVSLDKNERSAQSEGESENRNSIDNCNTTINNEVKQTPRKTECKGVKAKILSPGKDSQLMFLSMESPISDHPQSKIKPLYTISEVPSVSDCQNFPEVKRTNSEALIRRSQESNKNAPVEKSSSLPGEMPIEVSTRFSDSNHSSVDDRKRKRINQEQLNRTKKRSRNDNTLNRNTINSSHSESQEQHNASSKLIDIKVSLESDSSRSAREYYLHERTEMPKKKYKRIVRAASSDTDSNDEMSLPSSKTDTRLNKERFPDKHKFNKSNKSFSSQLHSTSQVSANVREAWPTKRKRVDAKDSSSDDEDVNAIVKEWCNGLPTAQKFARKANESVKDASVYKKSINTPLTSQSTALTVIETNARKSLEPYFKESSSMDFNCTGFAKTPSKESLGCTTVEKEPGDIRDQVINDIIGRVRQIQNADKDSSPREDPKNTNSSNTAHTSDRNLETTQRENLMEDNFDEAIANVDTQALMNASFSENTVVCKKENTMRTTAKITSIESQEKLTTNQLPSSINKTPRKLIGTYKTYSETPKPCSSSDKENDNCMISRLKNSLNVGNVAQNVQRSEESQTERKNTNVASSNSVGHGQIMNTKINAMDLSFSGDDNGDSPQKDSLFSHDTMINITQYSKMLKQIEDDILGPAKPLGKKQDEDTSDQLRQPEERLQTPKRTAERTRNKDMEQSGEDEIVESTPEVRTKSSLKGSSSSLTRNRETPVSSPLSTANTAKDSEYSPVTEYLRTPQIQKGIFPLHQSTPKVPDVLAKDSPVSTRNFVFVCSKLTTQEINRVKEFAQMCNGTYVNQFNPDVTHVIVKMDKENNATDRTLKYLQGVAHRKWIVSYDWVVKSIAQRHPVDEEPYEAVDSGSLEAGPRNSRCRERGIFEDFAFFTVGSYTHMTIEQCQDLLRATGATIVETPEELAAVKNRLKPIALFSDNNCDAPVDWYRELKIAAVSESWIVDCISQFKVVPFAPYLVNIGASELSSNYPEELLIEDNESDVDDFDNETLQ